MKLFKTLAFLVILVLVLSLQAVEASTSAITRHEIQSFLKQPGNAIANPDWARNYQNKAVRWHGIVYRVHVINENQPVEILLKILPSNQLYDTVLTVPPGHPWATSVRPGQTLEFQGIITGVVDTVIVKEVHVLLYGSQSAMQP